MTGMRKEYILSEQERCERRTVREWKYRKIRQGDAPVDLQPISISRSLLAQTEVDEVANLLTKIKHIQDIYCPPNSAPSITIGMTVQLSPVEAERLQELALAVKETSFAETVHASPSLIRQSEIIDLTKITELRVRLLIEMCRKISAFGSLCQECQIALLKGIIDKYG